MPSIIETDVLIAGTGPTGLVLANLLGARGINVTLIEKRAELIDYPRGVGLDDESYRTIQAMGLIEQVEPYTLPHHVMRIVNGRGEVLMTNAPQGEPFGFPRKFGFIQPLVDRAVYEGLARYPNVQVIFGRELAGLEDHGEGVTVNLNHVTGEEGENATGDTTVVNARFMVGCEGGRSFTRKWMGVDFEGVSPSTRWVVIDVRNDPLGIPNVYLGADPARPYVSIGLPHGVRRFEFLLFDDEPNERVEDNAFVTSLLHEHLPEGIELDIIRRRVFTHHGRVASNFHQGNVLIAGDAAHLMPVWMGQGFNSGVRDATNLAWKLDAVIKGKADATLLDTYSQERLDHAKAMVDLSLTLGNLIKPTDRKIAFGRDVLARVANLSPQVREYFSDMRFKPMPRYSRGVVVDQETLSAGTAKPKISGSRVPKLIPLRNALRKDSTVGTQFIQPRVTFKDEQVLLDDALGNGFAILSWGMDPANLLSEEARAGLAAQGVQLLCAVSPNQVDWAAQQCAATGTRVVLDDSGALKNWFDKVSVGTVVIRPDRFIAAACLNGNLPRAIKAVYQAASLKDDYAATSAASAKAGLKAVKVG
ncbi:bifunctional 3-(3-hydroxy-phenyl)propionate/3-hydroxycinnamic acid hydroxylase MhpA [Corynebacterium sp. A21]|uniref:bifunctional 3-(3-hydroxy-phenyl)propionate/3-hydroxycinnamic acid hydroxylase MhpA n=1 Tax=Corynebacterium sp. A21 TaxID=3457318 RepID=UPI003FCFF314